MCQRLQCLHEESANWFNSSQSVSNLDLDARTQKVSELYDNITIPVQSYPRQFLHRPRRYQAPIARGMQVQEPSTLDNFPLIILLCLIPMNVNRINALVILVCRWRVTSILLVVWTICKLIIYLGYDGSALTKQGINML